MMNLVNTPGGAEIKAIMARELNPEAKAFGVVPVKHRSTVDLG